MKNNFELVQELLETRLNSLNEKIDSNNKNIIELLSFIREQTTRTNGRVTVLESRMNTLAVEEANHLSNCPRVTDIKALGDKIDKFADENFIIKVINRWPKQVIGIIIAGVIFTIATLGYGLWQGHEAMAEIKTELLKNVK